MNKKVIFVLTIMLLAIVAFSEAFVPRIGVAGSASYKSSLLEKLSKLYEIVPIEKKDYQIILEIWKEQDIGLRKKELETSQLPDVNYLIELSENVVTFYDLSNATMKKIFIGDKAPEESVINFFQNFVLIFKLPTFVDKTAKPGDWYAALDRNGDVIGYFQNNETSTTITIPAAKYKGAVYARKLRKSLIYNNKVIYEISEKDLYLQIPSSEHFKVFEDGQDVNLTVLIQKGGFLYIFDIYKNHIMCIKSEPVEMGKYTFSFTAYKEEDNVKETLIFVLEKTPLESCEELSFDELREILQRADGVDLITFVVK
ncbi:MAG: hypothetical protein J7L34_05455 [Thermotogaceae bacterium]|nr:hypothetical protein [Thermotogaceae bacterium]